MSDSVNRFLQESSGSKYPAGTFDKVGTRYEGIIDGLPKTVDTQYGERLLIDLANPAYPGGGITLWVKSGPMGAAIASAVGTQGLQEGGKLSLAFTGEKDTGKPSPLKVYEAHYEPPVAKVDVTSIFGGDQ